MNEQMFQIGEIAVTQGYTVTFWNGLEIVVLGAMEYAPSRYANGEDCPPTWLYPVQWADGHKTWEPYWKLRKKRPPSEEIPEMEGFEVEA